ncbi:hypothetical protein MKX67_11440 [Cytobacillus sp. FSL W7-1323]|uniref:Small, acid-soluble spore protein N n=1 Tax=Cytobacillus kochii TaxID=859143 RepID=A0A248TNN6_9BACI|nr:MULTISPECIES: hypothetical protein [Cytobacillus]ASV69772.1 hypothetical protein CKF48_22165 [Cytobacillus kochii]MCA1025961.1 hypothetical protein [Cytobacillus kochii]MCM3321445.1 hypothetical protein [Cytobacillus kochii]MCM3343721.1 hypothetical protein [Cytobacillus kochii]MDM5207552.1 hypothetical protein [Cytobacillus kochii]
MPYHKNKQQAFQAAQQSMEDVEEQYHVIDKHASTYGQQLKHLSQEIAETYEQIQNALEVASEHQKEQLLKFQTDLDAITSQVQSEK